MVQQPSRQKICSVEWKRSFGEEVTAKDQSPGSESNIKKNKLTHVSVGSDNTNTGTNIYGVTRQIKGSMNTIQGSNFYE